MSETVLVFGAPEQRYTVTADDRLWLLRAVQREGPVATQVAQVLVNCFCLLAVDKPGRYLTLASFVRAYAQPVNPRQFPGGDLHEARVARMRAAIDAAASHMRADLESKLRRELHAAKMRRDVFSLCSVFDPSVARAVERALSAGPADIPACATDYCAPWATPDRGRVSLGKPERGRNQLCTRAPSWPGYRVDAWAAQS